MDDFQAPAPSEGENRGEKRCKASFEDDTRWVWENPVYKEGPYTEPTELNKKLHIWPKVDEPPKEH
jgi:hypothetical protein